MCDLNVKLNGFGPQYKRIVMTPLALLRRGEGSICRDSVSRELFFFRAWKIFSRNTSHPFHTRSRLNTTFPSSTFTQHTRRLCVLLCLTMMLVLQRRCPYQWRHLMRNLWSPIARWASRICVLHLLTITWIRETRV